MFFNHKKPLLKLQEAEILAIKQCRLEHLPYNDSDG